MVVDLEVEADVSYVVLNTVLNVVVVDLLVAWKVSKAVVVDLEVEADVSYVVLNIVDVDLLVDADVPRNV